MIPGLYVQGYARKTVAAINEALEARQVRKDGLRTAASRSVLQAPPAPIEAPSDGLIRGRLPGTLAPRCPRARC